MLLALGAVSSAMEALQSLTSSKASSPRSTGLGQGSNSPFDLGSSPGAGSAALGSTPGASSQLSPATMSALLAAQSQSSAEAGTPAPTGRSEALNHLFSSLGGDGKHGVSKAQFDEALGAGGSNVAKAEEVFGKLDTNGDGSVSLDELSAALKGKGRHHHHHTAADGSDGNNSNSTDPLLQALSGASSSSTTNGDGSTTTSLTFGDGSKVTMTSPVPKTVSAIATSSYNFLEQMIAREAQAISSGTSASLSLKV